MNWFTTCIHNVITTDKKNATLCLQTFDKADMILIANVKNEIQNNVNASLSISTLNANYHKTTILDKNNNPHTFGICFILEWDSTYTKVQNADLISFVEL